MEQPEKETLLIDTYETSDIDKIKKLIEFNEKRINNMHPEEKYREPKLEKDLKFPIVDYINLKVPEISTKKELYLKTYLYPPSEEEFPVPKGLIFLYHGMGAYSEPSILLADYLAKVGLIVAAVDYRGFGGSEGSDGDIKNFDYLLSDCEIFMKKTEEYLKQKYENNGFLQNKFIGGISMGGLTSYLLTYKKSSTEFKGAIFFAPAFSTRVTCFQSCLLSTVSCLCPGIKLPKPKKESLIAKNPEYFENPDPVIMRTNTRLRTVHELDKKTKVVAQNCDKYEVPFVIIIAGIDKMVKNEGLVDFYEKAKSKDKQVWYYNNCWHAIYIEHEMLDILPRLQKWVSDRI